MRYIEATIYTSSYGLEPVTALLEEAGIFGVAVEDPEEIRRLLEKKNPYDWDYVDPSVLALQNREPSIRFYLDDTEEGRKQLEEIRIRMMLLKGSEYEGRLQEGATLGRMYLADRLVDDSQWQDTWKEYFRPVKVTDRLVIRPGWEMYEPEGPDELVLSIDPGMAFGTGAHATTVLCLELLEKYMEPGDAVLDIGCGSGILSIAAALLEAGQVLGIELDPQAVAVAVENVALNGMSHRVEIREGDLTRGISCKADLLLSNLMADLVMLLSDAAASHLTERGIWISSGILTEKRDRVVSHLKERGFRIVEVRERDEWCAIAAKAKGKV